jgi:hypothetical protein
MDNKIYNIGDVLMITVKPRQKGTATLSSFSDSLLGLTDDRTVLREFRIVEDDLFYTDWAELTTENIQGKKLKQNNVIEVRYTRQGTDESGEIEFQSIQFNGDFDPEVINSPILDSSVFSDIAWTDETERLAKNLFKKLYFRGIIPTYVLRGDNVDNVEDEDYIALFYSIAKFYAIMACFFKRFENFYNDEELMLEWIRQNGIYFDESTVTLEQLQYLARHLYDEIRRRGTKMIFNYEGDLVNGVPSEIDGEFIRLIRSKRSDELIYETIPLHKLGWCMGVSSPMYRGTCSARLLNKTGENTEDFQDINNYTTFTNQFSTISIEAVGDRQCLMLNSRLNMACGLGRYGNNTSAAETDKLYVADPYMDYEITFMFYEKTPVAGIRLSFGVEGFDASKNKLSDAFVTTNNSEVTEMFLSDLQLVQFVPHKWYFVRGIIHAYSSDTVENVKLNIGFGNNLSFNNRFLKYILPKIYIRSNSFASVAIWNYKIRPLVRGTNILPLKNGSENSHSLGFIQSSKIFYSYFRNNNNSQSKEEITDIIERYLLPFNTTDILQFIGSE